MEYPGKEIEVTHETMFITEELFSLRQSLLEDSLKEGGTRGEIARTLAANRRRVQEKNRQGFPQDIHEHEMVVQKTFRYYQAGKCLMGRQAGHIHSKAKP